MIGKVFQVSLVDEKPGFWKLFDQGRQFARRDQQVAGRIIRI
jgi:hypothetical protein